MPPLAAPRAPPRRWPARPAARRGLGGDRPRIHRQCRLQQRRQARRRCIGLIFAPGAAAQIAFAGRSTCRKRSGRRSASQRSSSSHDGGGVAARRWCTSPCSRATSRPGRGSRRARAGARQRRASSRCVLRGRCGAATRRRGVVPLPRSCVSAAKRAGSGASAAPPCRAPASVTPVSISGWWSARCGTPHRRSTSGSIRASAPQARSTSNMREGRSPSARAPIPARRARAPGASTSPSSTMCRISAMRLGRQREIGEARGEARHAQDAHRVFGEGVGRHGAARAPRGRAGRHRGR